MMIWKTTKTALNLSWSDLNALGKNRFSKTSYVWLIIVPISVNLLSKTEFINGELLGGIPFDINTDLPFSWYLFFFGALFFSLGTSVYTIWCPKFIKKFNNFTEFDTEGRIHRELEDYANQYGILDELHSFIQEANLTPLDGPAELGLSKEAFRIVYNAAERRNTTAQMYCFGLYSIGTGLFLIVLVQNVLTVFEYLLTKLI